VRQVLVRGHDAHSGGSHPPPGFASSAQGASWVFTQQQLAAAGAFLALGVGGAALAPVHGGPVRLVVPGWFGCAHIKWVDGLRLGDPARAAPTAQMREFASRTNQLLPPPPQQQALGGGRGGAAVAAAAGTVPALAALWRPALIPHSVTVLSVERWAADPDPPAQLKLGAGGGAVRYLVKGVKWGGNATAAASCDVFLRFGRLGASAAGGGAAGAAGSAGAPPAAVSSTMSSGVRMLGYGSTATEGAAAYAGGCGGAGGFRRAHGCDGEPGLLWRPWWYLWDPAADGVTAPGLFRAEVSALPASWRLRRGPDGACAGSADGTRPGRYTCGGGCSCGCGKLDRVFEVD
jgi:hypothetical protein